MAYRKPPVSIQPRTPENPGPESSVSPREANVGSKIVSSAPLTIPGTEKRSHLPPPPLPPPQTVAYAQDNTLPDHGWNYANGVSQMKPDSALDSPTTSIRSWGRRDSTRSSNEDEFRQRKHSASMTVASLRSPLLIETFNHSSEGYKDSLLSPSGTPGDNMLTTQRTYDGAYDDKMKRKIGASTPGKPFQQGTFDLPARGPPTRNVPFSQRSLTIRNLSLQDSGPDSPRKLSSLNDPLWEAGSNSLQTTDSFVSPQTSYFASPITDNSVSSMTSWGSVIQQPDKMVFGRYSGPPKHMARESGLSLGITAQSALHAANSAASPTPLSPTNSINNSYVKPGLIPSARQNTLPQDVHSKTGDAAASRTSLRPFYQQEEIVILPTHHPDHSHHVAHPTNRLIMPSTKRKGAPDSSDRDGPPLQQIQQEGKRSPNPITKTYPSPRSTSFAQPQHHHISSSTDRLPPSVNPLSDHDPNSPYLNTLAIDPGLDSSAHPYPVDAQQLAAAAAQSVNNLPPEGMDISLTKAKNIGYQCECCLKKPKRFNTELELRAHMNEKQYVCPFCRNRFKNKNEMERHQMSLHLRDRSWSCAALERNYEAAFHPSTAIPPNNPGHAQQMVPPPPAASDVCGYCGQLFPNPPDFVARGEHLTNVHKFAECNQSKKFWRADHFRQHLKHSHGGIPGKWTNMLEQACLKMEPSPLTPQQQEDAGGMAQQQVAHAARAAQAAAEQAQQAVQQQQQQQAQRQKQIPHRQQQPEDNLHLPPLTTFQAAQLQNATNMALPSDTQRGPYPSAMNDFGPVAGGPTD